MVSRTKSKNTTYIFLKTSKVIIRTWNISLNSLNVNESWTTNTSLYNIIKLVRWHNTRNNNQKINQIISIAPNLRKQKLKEKVKAEKIPYNRKCHKTYPTIEFIMKLYQKSGTSNIYIFLNLILIRIPFQLVGFFNMA